MLNQLVLLRPLRCNLTFYGGRINLGVVSHGVELLVEPRHSPRPRAPAPRPALPKAPVQSDLRRAPKDPLIYRGSLGTNCFYIMLFAKVVRAAYNNLNNFSILSRANTGRHRAQ